jgi:uncharacterized membrane protein
MAEEIDNVLRRSLDEVDRTRKIQWSLLAISFCGLVLFLYGIFATARDAGEPRLVGQVMVLVLVSILTNVLVALGLGIFISRMARKILKAIELLSKE